VSYESLLRPAASGDFLAMQALADWYEEGGEEALASGWRWMGEKRRRPFLDSGRWCWLVTMPSARFLVWQGKPAASRLFMAPALLPHCLLPVLGAWEHYGTQAAAYVAVLARWSRLTDGERAACRSWAPPG